MTKFIAVQGCVLKMTPFIAGTAQITTPPSDKAKAGGKPCYRGALSVVVSGYGGGAVTAAGSGAGSGTINGSSAKCLIDGQAAVLEGDSAVVTVNGTTTDGSPASQAVLVEIESAGQAKAKTE